MMFLLLLGALAQDPASPSAVAPIGPRPAQDSARPWRTVDRIVMVVNQDIITESQLLRDLQSVARTRKLTTDTERRAAESQILGDRVRQRLRVQAGAILGVDEKLIDARVADSLEQMQKRENGVVGLSKFLESRDVSGPDVRRLLRDDIYDQLYRDGLTGDAPGPLGRVVADRYVRPGALHLQYVQAVDRPAEMDALGGSVGRVKFQQIILDISQSGGADAARELARGLVARIEAGEDMGSLAREVGGVREGDGVTDVEEARLRELFPEIAAFTEKAAPGQLSSPIETAPRGKPLLRIVRFLERTPAKVPEFADATVQSKLRERSQERLEQYRLEGGYAALLRSSYVWPPELSGRQP
ncbi:MAG: peptidylprolyl isomerase [Planctomycetota bacterium]|nr:peptidylprolyl isomerase [Planctomycetota bacterium]